MARSRPAKVVQFRHRPGRRRRAPTKPAGTGPRGFLVLLVALPLAAFTAVFPWDGPPRGVALSFEAEPNVGFDRERANFALCDGPVRVNCDVDGDTFWYRGEKIRIADINTPEVSNPGCDAEADLGQAATRRLHTLLNQGSFSLERDPESPDRDRYGRSLRVVTREGQSVGDVLVSEGLAEE